MPEGLENLGVVDGLVQLSMLVQWVFARAAKARDLSSLQARLLGVLRDREPTMAELRRVLGLDKSSTTGLVDRAERRGIARRIEVPEDGRSLRVQLTDEGHELADKFVAEVSGQLLALTNHLTETNRHRLALLASSLVLHNAAELGVELSVGTARAAPGPSSRNGNEPMTTPSASPDPNSSARQQRIAVVIGSTRPSRICPGIASWVLQALQESSPLAYELLDLANVNLPFLDEPIKAALRQYQHEHTKSWSRTVDSYDGFVFVFPQYNWGYPAALKNALDFLYHEWNGKPASYVTYGTHGGNKGAEQLSGVLHGLKIRELPDHLEVFIVDDDVDNEWQLRDLDALMRPYHERIKVIDAQMVEALEDTQQHLRNRTPFPRVSASASPSGPHRKK